jgi:hypothetical protein
LPISVELNQILKIQLYLVQFVAILKNFQIICYRYFAAAYLDRTSCLRQDSNNLLRDEIAKEIGLSFLLQLPETAAKSITLCLSV